MKAMGPNLLLVDGSMPALARPVALSTNEAQNMIAEIIIGSQ